MYNSARVVEEGKTLLKVVFFQEKGTKVDVTKPAIAEAENSFEIVQHFLLQYCILKYSGTVENALELKTEWLKDYHLRL
jgi:hypothetical protein